MTPWDVFILAESLSVRLLLISLPVVPYFGSLSLSHFSKRAACFCRRCTWCSRSLLPPGPGGGSSPLSSCTCSLSSSFTLASSRSFFRCNSDRVPLHSLEALEGSLRPSRAKKVPPRRSISWQTKRTSRNNG